LKIKSIKEMAKLSKNRKANLEAYDADKEYSLEEAAGIIKKIAGTTKFDSSVDLAVL